MGEQSEVKPYNPIDQSGNEVSVAKRRQGRSLFVPVALITVGSIFLLANLGLIPQPNWLYAFGFWPLLLIFIGINILVTQLPAPGGTFLSLLVSLAAAGVFGYLLLAGPTNAAVRSFGIPTSTQEVQEYPFSAPAGVAESAEIELDLGNFPASVTDAADVQTLVEGTIWTSGDLLLDVDSDEQITSVQVGEESDFTNFLNPMTWLPEAGDHTWQIDLNQNIPLDLRINAGNGAVSLDLDALSLSQFRLDSSNGSVTAALPDGNYDGRIDSGNGALRVSLPSHGRQNLRIDSGNGSIRLALPDDVQARIEFETGNGSVSVDSRFDLIDGDSEEGTYETAGYSASGDGILLVVDTGNGSVQISPP